MRTVEEHRDRLLALVRPSPGATRRLLESRGLALAAPARAALDLPGFDNSAMDGYAVRVADTRGASPQSPVSLPVVDDVAAGDTRALTLPPGVAMRIMTGAPLPVGAEGIVPVEDTDGGVETVALTAAPDHGRHVRRRGEDVRAGEELVGTGTLLTPGVIALLAAAGVAEVDVHPRPRVAVFSTGDELVPLGVTPGFGQIVDSNQVMLAELVRAAGADLVHCGTLPDEAEAVRRVLSEPPGQPDLVLTSGGVSMGAHDTVKEVLTELGTVDFVKVAMRPGMPQGAGTVGGVPIVTLPGNPVSSFVSFHVFVLPMIRLLAGRAAGSDAVEVVAGADWPSADGKVEFTRVRVEGGVALPARGQGSHMLGALASANALAVVPADTAYVNAGDTLAAVSLLGLEHPR